MAPTKMIVCYLFIFFFSSCQISGSPTQSATAVPPFLVTTTKSESIPNPFVRFRNSVLDGIESEILQWVVSVRFYLTQLGAVIGSPGLLGEAQDGNQTFSTPYKSPPLSTPAVASLYPNETAQPELQAKQVLFSTPFATFWSSVASSFTLTLVTEFGDRTFFIAALLATKQPKFQVLFGTCLALIIQTIFSTLVGQLLHRLPSTATSFMAFPFDDYAAALLLFVFGIIHLRAALNPIDETEELMASCYGDKNLPQKHDDPKTDANADHSVYTRCPSFDRAIEQEHQLPDLNQFPDRKTFDGYCASLTGKSSSTDTKSELLLASTMCDSGALSATSPSSMSLREGELAEYESIQPHAVRHGPSVTKSREYRKAEEATEKLESQHSGSTPRTLGIFAEVFWIIFVAELGDKSMISTVALAAAQNAYGVFVGASCAHCFITLLAVIAGALLQGYISERIANTIGAVLFLTFGIMTVLEGLARQGIRLWWFLGEKASALFIAYFITVKNISLFHTSSLTSDSPSFVDSLFRMIVS